MKEKDLKYTPKTHEQFILEEQSKQDQKIANSYAAELDAYSDISVQRGYGPCLTYNPECRCSLEELQRQRLILENREVEERINRANNQNTEINNGQQNEELQRLRNEFANLQVNTGNTINNLQTNLTNEQNARQTAEQQRNQAITERDRRPNINQADYNNLIREHNDLRQQVINLTNERDQRPDISIEACNQLRVDLDQVTDERNGLRDQQITEFRLDIFIEGGSQTFYKNFEEIEKKVKSLEKLDILFSCVPRLDPRDGYSRHFDPSIIGRWVTRLQKFIDQNPNLTHLDIKGEFKWCKEHFFDFSKLAKLKFLSIFSPHQADLDLKENKELETLQIKTIQYNENYPCYRSRLNNLSLKENKELKCLILTDLDIYDLDLSENKDLEYVNISSTRINHLDLSRNRKITGLGGSFNRGETWKIEYDRGRVSFDRNNQAVELA